MSAQTTSELFIQASIIYHLYLYSGDGALLSGITISNNININICKHFNLIYRYWNFLVLSKNLFLWPHGQGRSTLYSMSEKWAWKSFYNALTKIVPCTNLICLCNKKKVYLKFLSSLDVFLTLYVGCSIQDIKTLNSSTSRKIASVT